MHTKPTFFFQFHYKHHTQHHAHTYANVYPNETKASDVSRSQQVPVESMVVDVKAQRSTKSKTNHCGRSASSSVESFEKGLY